LLYYKSKINIAYLVLFQSRQAILNTKYSIILWRGENI
jgi:hypothetical protein